jgi:hypothetical protein
MQQQRRLELLLLLLLLLCLPGASSAAMPPMPLCLLLRGSAQQQAPRSCFWSGLVAAWASFRPAAALGRCCCPHCHHQLLLLLLQLHMLLQALRQTLPCRTRLQLLLLPPGRPQIVEIPLTCY